MKTEATSSHRFGVALIKRTEGLLASVSPSLSLLILRLALAIPFLKSGMTKWDGFLTLSQGARFLFEQEFKLHILGREIPYPFPLAMATAAGIGELILPVFLILGLATRFAALGLLVMTAIIQLTIPDGWANFHLPWAAMAIALVVFGGGRIAIDPFVVSRFK